MMINAILIALIILIVLFVLYIFSTRCRKGHSDLAALRGWNYTHRGLHSDDAPENSLEAFRRAVNAGYGSELDVHLLADGRLAVIHDSLLKRVCNKEGRIEDLTSEELSDCYIKGTEYTVPLFTDVLKVYDGNAPLIVEIKAYNNVNALCEKVAEVLDRYNGAFCVESFDPRCVYWFRKHRPQYIRGQLTENYFCYKNSPVPGVLKMLLYAVVFNFMTLPDFVAYRYAHRKHFSHYLCRKLWKADSVTWTLVSKEEYDIAVSEGMIPIFEGFVP